MGRRTVLPPKTSGKTGKGRRKRQEQPIVQLHEQVEFLWPSTIAPRYILKGTVVSIIPGACTDGPHLYTIELKTQEVFPLETSLEDRVFPDTVEGRTVAIGRGLIEGVRQFKGEATP